MLDFTVTTDAEGNLHLGPRVIPVPTSISEAARRFLANPFPETAQPDVNDKAAWRAKLAAMDETALQRLQMCCVALVGSIQ